MTLYSLCKRRTFLQQILIFSLAVLTGIAMFSGISYADITETAKLVPEDGAYNDLFGSSVSISGDYAIVGAPNDDEGTIVNSGCAYIFERTKGIWSEKAKLLAPDRSRDDIFGSSVSISGDYAIVGKPFDDHTGSNYGSAYIFHRTEPVPGTIIWGQMAKLVASDGGANDYFGSSVAISGDFAIVGAPFNDDNGSDSGSSYIFQRSGSTWSQVEKLLPAEVTIGDLFGYSVAINGDDAVVGAPRDDNERGTTAGSIYIFQRSDGTWSGWRLIDPNGAAEDEFGWSVSIDGHFAIAGAHYYDGGTELANSGSARIFEEIEDTGIWGTLSYHRLIPSDTAASDEFGFSVSISSECAVIGTLKYINGNGTVYVFRKSTDDNNWPQLEKLIASDGSPWGFGSAVSISGPYVIVGAKWDINSAGSAYVYDIFAGPSPPHSGTMPAIPLLLLDD